MHTLRALFRSLSSRERALFLAASFVATLGIASLALATLLRVTAPAPAHGGSYTEGFAGQPIAVNPVTATSDVDRSLSRLLFADVLSLTDTIDPSKDFKTWRIRLKENLAWTDGEKLTSDDILFTIREITDPESHSPLRSTWEGVSVERKSELELVFTLGAPYPRFPEFLGALFPIPQHIWSAVPPQNWRLSEFNLRPVGSGPYRFKTYEKEASGFIARYTLEENPAFTGTKPYIPEFVAVFSESLEGMVRNFNNGTVDGFATPDPTLLQGISRSNRIHAFRLPSYYAVFINQTENPALRDLAVRKALSFSLDRDALIRTVLAGRGFPAEGPLAPHVIASPGVIQKEDAATLLDAAGWALKDGVRAKATAQGSVPLAFTLLAPDIPFLKSTAEEMVKTWKALGIAATLQTASPNEIGNHAIATRDYDAILFGNVLGPTLDLTPFWHSGERFAPGLNLALYGNAKADDLMETIRRASSTEERLAKQEELEAMIEKDFPAVFLYSPSYLFVARKDLKGVSEILLGEPSDRMREVTEWYTKTSRAVR